MITGLQQQRIRQQHIFPFYQIMQFSGHDKIMHWRDEQLFRFYTIQNIRVQSINQDFNSGWQTATRQSKM